MIGFPLWFLLNILQVELSWYKWFSPPKMLPKNDEIILEVSHYLIRLLFWLDLCQYFNIIYICALLTETQTVMILKYLRISLFGPSNLYTMEKNWINACNPKYSHHISAQTKKHFIIWKHHQIHQLSACLQTEMIICSLRQM